MLNDEEKLDVKILQTGYSISYGSTALKLLQNNHIPELDLLVREAIQNSSDASLNNEEEFCSVDFNTGEFEPTEFNKFLKEAETVLNKRFSKGKGTYLEIRDTGTSGLTGGVRLSDIKDDDHGNFFKLVYDTGKKQENNTAGGNWGFGKSVYYRVGIGIVIYYSRIKSGDNYENRLIITLIEDESKKDSNGRDATILNSMKGEYAGRAWWGIKENEEELLPVTDIEKIQAILNVFGIHPFNREETGTSIIIPYIDTQALLNGIIPANDLKKGDEAGDNDESDVRRRFKSMFLSDISEYLKLSIQRWYAPKIDNQRLREVGLKWLRVSINNDCIKRDSEYMLPFFKMVQDMYNAALFGENKSDDFKQIRIYDIKINNYFETSRHVGYTSMLELPKSTYYEMQQVFSPYDLIGKFEDNGNEPVVMYARDLGMVINYETSGCWVKNLISLSDREEYLFAFFVPNTKNVIKKDLKVREYAGMQLGEYLRECEASDHMSWEDPVRMQIVQRIRSNTISKIQDSLKEEVKENADSTMSRLSYKIGKSLLPRVGYGGKKHHPKDIVPGKEINGGNSHNVFVIKSTTFEKDYIKINFSVRLTQGDNKVSLCMMVASEDSISGVSVKQWEDDIGTKFPIQFIDCYIDKIKTLDSCNWDYVGQTCNNENKILTMDKLTVKLMSETGNTPNTQIQFLTNNIGTIEVEGIIDLKSDDKKCQVTLYI